MPTSNRSNPVNSKAKTLHRNILGLTLCSFLTDVSSEMLLNLLPLFLLNVLGVRTALIGFIEGVAEATASLVKVLSGTLSDRIQQRKRLAIFGYGLSTVAKPFLYVVTSWGGVMGVRFFDRLGKGIRTAPRDALLAASADPNRRGFSFGFHRAGDTAGALVGLAAVMGIIWATQTQTTTLSRGTFRWVVIASVIPAILAVLALALFVGEVTYPTSSPPLDLAQKSLRKIDRRYLNFLFIVTLFTLGNSSDAFIILRAQERGLSLLQVMAMAMSFNAVYALLSTVFGTLSDVIGRGRVLLFGWASYGLIYLGFGLAQTGRQIWILFACYGIFYAATEGTAKAFIADLVPEPRRGSAYGLYHTAVGLTTLPASFLAGSLWGGIGAWEGLGPGAPFFFGACMAFLAAILFLFIFPSALEKPTKI